MKKLHVTSYGCQMNVYDGQRMADVLAPEGYVETDDINEADVVVLNTCNIREKAADRVYSTLGRVREIKDARSKNGLETAIVVAGCVAQAEGAEIQRRNSAVDLVLGPQNYHRLPQLLKQARGRHIVDTQFPADDKFEHLPAPSPAAMARRGVTAFVTVQEGCDKFCAFCVVPYTRGSEVSRPARQILEEVRRLAGAGVREVTLIGQNVNAYHGAGPDGRDWTLARLMEAVAEIAGIARIRYMTSHPNDMGEDLIAAHRDLPQLMPFLHLPVQSGSDSVLKAMNRRHTRDTYLKVIERARHVRPDMAFSSDFIVGFPGETDRDFADTLGLIDSVGFAMAYAFKYSTRPGTPAADAVNQVPETVMAARLLQLQGKLEQQRVALQGATIGKRLPVLLEREGKHPGQLAGKTPCLQAVQIDATPQNGATCRMGDIVMVEIVGCGTFSLFGEWIASALAA